MDRLKDSELLSTTDGQVWAQQFNLVFAELHEGTTLDEGWLIGWFANAIETGRSAGLRQSLSQEAVRDEAVEALACPRPLVMGEHACKNRKQCWEPCGDLGHHEEYALKREPNAAGQAGRQLEPPLRGDVVGPAPAAPDVANFLAHWIADGHLQTFEDRQRFRNEAAALLAKLGQGWIPSARFSWGPNGMVTDSQGGYVWIDTPGASDE